MKRHAGQPRDSPVSAPLQERPMSCRHPPRRRAAPAARRAHACEQGARDRYGHLMPGNEDDAVALVDAYLERTAGLGVTRAKP